MLKGLLCSVAMIGLLAATPALAETGALADCTDANMMFANADVAKMAAGDKKTMAMKEMETAKDHRARKESEKCKISLSKAIDLARTVSSETKSK
ncbi:MAG: hypothetical protein ABI439_08030 [Rhodospirillales bacterium]